MHRAPRLTVPLRTSLRVTEVAVIETRGALSFLKGPPNIQLLDKQVPRLDRIAYKIHTTRESRACSVRLTPSPSIRIRGSHLIGVECTENVIWRVRRVGAAVIEQRDEVSESVGVTDVVREVADVI
jgi:hypothetical protein